MTRRPTSRARQRDIRFRQRATGEVFTAAARRIETARNDDEHPHLALDGDYPMKCVLCGEIVIRFRAMLKGRSPTPDWEGNAYVILITRGEAEPGVARLRQELLAIPGYFAPPESYIVVFEWSS